MCMYVKTTGQLCVLFLGAVQLAFEAVLHWPGASHIGQAHWLQSLGVHLSLPLQHTPPLLAFSWGTRSRTQVFLHKLCPGPRLRLNNLRSLSLVFVTVAELTWPLQVQFHLLTWQQLPTRVQSQQTRPQRTEKKKGSF